MVRVVIYGEHKEETEGLEGMLRAILTEKQRWPVIHTYIGNLESYLHFVRGNPYLIMLVSVMGKKGARKCFWPLSTQEGKTGGIFNRLSFEDGKTGKNREITGGAL